MSEIDETKCIYYQECIQFADGEEEYHICNNDKNPTTYCQDSYDCYYKQLQQVIKDRDYYKQIVDGCKSENGNCSFCEIDKQFQQLKAENEKLLTQNYYLDKANLGLAKENEELVEENEQLKQCLDEIEKIVKLEDCLNCPSLELCSFSEKNCNDFKIEAISELIKQTVEE